MIILLEVLETHRTHESKLARSARAKALQRRGANGLSSARLLSGMGFLILNCISARFGAYIVFIGSVRTAEAQRAAFPPHENG
jgi:hypothetical protein